MSDADSYPSLPRHPRDAPVVGRMRCATLIGVILLALQPWSAGASGFSAADTIRTPSGPLEVATFAFVKALVEVSGEEMADTFVPAGVRLQVDGEDYAGLSSRQAVASIREFMREYERTTALVVRAAPVEGSPTRGFAEILWSGWASGTSHHLRRTVFIGLRYDGDIWRVDEVRFLR